MTTTEFCFWLDGYLIDKKSKEVKPIKKILEDVLAHEQANPDRWPTTNGPVTIPGGSTSPGVHVDAVNDIHGAPEYRAYPSGIGAVQLGQVI